MAAGETLEAVVAEEALVAEGVPAEAAVAAARAEMPAGEVEAVVAAAAAAAAAATDGDCREPHRCRCCSLRPCPTSL